MGRDKTQWVLGLDIGTSSIGWAAIATVQGKPQSVIGLGVRIFEAGVEGDIEHGKDGSRAIPRRKARQQRRQIRRRQQRDRRVFNLLRRAGLLPDPGIATPTARHDCMNALDKKLRDSYLSNGDRIGHHLLPYLLRAKAVEGPIEAHALGRALYHLSQRRGFKSNRRADRSDKTDERSKVKKAISQLEQDMGDMTLGQYFATIDPEEQRIRQRWTSRQMYESEFERIRQVQQNHHPSLVSSFWDDLHEAIFHQRPLKSQSHLIGRCTLEPHRRRAPEALPSYQRFRLLQKLNDLSIVTPTGQREPLTDQQRSLLLDTLQREGDLKFNDARKLLKLDFRAKQDRKESANPKAKLSLFKYTFSHEGDGDQKLVGDRTAAKISPYFGDRWFELSLGERDSIVDDLLYYEHREALVRRAQQVWKVEPDNAEFLADVGLDLESSYASLSRHAIARLLPHLEKGIPFATARQQEYPQSFEAVEPEESLPPVLDWRDDVNNPAVIRAMTELRKLVNDLIRCHGKPDRVRIELARDLKRSRKDRKTLTEQIERNRKKREQAKKRILDELNITNPSHDDVLKIILADECNWICPYTGRGPFQMRELVGSQSQYDIEHIFPRKYLDNSYLNLTLCYHEENRNRKKDQLPYEAYASDDKRWGEILARVEAFKGDAAKIKLQRFQTQDVPDDFTSRHLNDTRYNSRLAADYLAMLFGGRCDEQGSMRVQTRTGMLTDQLRKCWHIHGLKKRGVNHLHHAVDAVVVALTDQATVSQLSHEAARQNVINRRPIAIDMPWEGFAEEIQDKLENIIVSHRINRRLAGPLHAETIYSKSHGSDKGKAIRHIRKPLAKLRKDDIRSDVKIVDPAVRDAIRKKWKALGAGDPDKVFPEAVTTNHPYMTSKDGRVIPIHRVRVRSRESTNEVGSGHRLRHVASGKDTNHHTVIVAKRTPSGEHWRDEPVSRLEAHRRLRDRKPVIQIQWGPGEHAVMVLHKNDAIEMDSPEGQRVIYIVQSVSKRDIMLKRHDDARLKKDIPHSEDQDRRIRSADALRKRHAQKVTISPLGQISPEGIPDASPHP